VVRDKRESKELDQQSGEDEGEALGETCEQDERR
jgi:hypothetical protein